MLNLTSPSKLAAKNTPRLQMLDLGFEPLPDFEKLPIPDLLNLEPRSSIDPKAVFELLDLAFLGKDISDEMDHVLSNARGDGGGFDADIFASDLFVADLIDKSFILELEGRRHPIHRGFIFRILCDPPTDVAAVHFRQEILRELDDDPITVEHAERLYLELANLLSMFKSPDHAANLDINAFRLDLLKQAKWVIDWMVEGFGHCRSGMRRLHEVGLAIQDSPEYAILADLLDYDNHLATLHLSIRIGGDGRIKALELAEAKENDNNAFYRTPPGRWLNRLKLLFRGYKLSNKEVVNRLVREVFVKISPPLTPLVQLIGHLELYLAARGFRRRAAERGLAMSLATFDPNRPPSFEKLFNPLLLDQPTAPTPSTLHNRRTEGITVLTGPNSGGKTRLLQSLGLAQLLGQSGIYTTAAVANLPMTTGLFVSLIERESADQAEGRLGREMIRIRKVFESMRSPAMVIFDELCSGTNPSEGTDIFMMVLRLLDRLDSISFISTHFLEFAKELSDTLPFDRLDFLQVEIDENKRSTYQFVKGVAESSLAAVTAERLGVTFDALSKLIERSK